MTRGERASGKRQRGGHRSGSPEARQGGAHAVPGLPAFQDRKDVVTGTGPVPDQAIARGGPARHRPDGVFWTGTARRAVAWGEGYARLCPAAGAGVNGCSQVCTAGSGSGVAGVPNAWWTRYVSRDLELQVQRSRTPGSQAERGSLAETRGPASGSNEEGRSQRAGLAVSDTGGDAEGQSPGRDRRSKQCKRRTGRASPGLLLGSATPLTQTGRSEEA